MSTFTYSLQQRVHPETKEADEGTELGGSGNAMDLISVIMPTYNAAQWVSDTIDNLAAQTYPHFELIVADDGSQDDTVAVVRQKLAHSFTKPWRVIEARQEPGPSAARNLALQSSPEAAGCSTSTAMISSRPRSSNCRRQAAPASRRMCQRSIHPGASATSMAAA